MAALLCQGLFDRFPRVRVAIIEAGAEWVTPLISKLKKVHGQMSRSFRSDPVDRLRQHIWIAPFYEDDLAKVKQAVGVEHILFGSDWPHAEGLPEPRNFALDLRRHGFAEDEIHTVMAKNGWVLTRRV
jgi:predicted TIM-barrel fold metal-dependent hydrolase